MGDESRNKPPQSIAEWQQILGQIIENEQILFALADELGIHQDTIKRWTQGTIPRNAVRMLRALCSASSFPSDFRGAFVEAVSKSYPDFGQAPNPLLENIPVKEIPSIFYSQIYRSFAYVAEDLLFWTLTSTITHQMFGHLDADQAAGVSAMILLCTPPARDCVQSLYAPVKQIGERPSPLPINFPHLVGLESPLADITPRYQRPAIFSEQDIRAFTSLSFPAEVISLLSIPIQRRGKVAGCFLVSSCKQSYWNDQRSLVAYEYSLLLGLAFRDQDFYAREQLCFGSFPSAAFQRQEEQRYPFRQRVRNLWRERHHLSNEQLEILALQGLEQNLLGIGEKNE
jgi:hypothetical protein